MVLSVLVMSIVIAMTIPIVDMFFGQSATVQNTFSTANQVLLASEILTEYTHDAVAACPASEGAACTAATGLQPFVTATSTSATFFADTNDTSTTTGPVKVSISLTGTTLTATIAKPTGSCPLTSAPTTVCAYGTAAVLTTVYHETNATPLSYLIAVGGQAQNGGSCSSASIANPSTMGSPTQVSEIVAMCIDLNAVLKGGQPTGYQSLAYMFSPGYNVNVG